MVSLATELAPEDGLSPSTMLPSGMVERKIFTVSAACAGTETASSARTVAPASGFRHVDLIDFIARSRSSLPETDPSLEVQLPARSIRFELIVVDL
jgi:hypothetical protein